MKMLIRLSLVLVLAVSAAPMAAPTLFGLKSDAPPATVAAERERPKANYDLASRWTSAKVATYVFSTAVTPHWLEFSDRFWYDYQTPAGRRWWIVDPVKKIKTPLFDNAKMAAQLTRILRTPYDAQHLPIGTIRFIENDTKIRFSVTLPRDARVENAAGEEITGMTQTQDQGRGGGGGGGGRGGGGRGVQQQQQGGRAGAPGAVPPVGNATWWLEYDFATQTATLNDKYKPEPAGPNWATVSPDKKYVVYARNYNLFMMDAANFELAKKNAADPAIVETQLTTDGVKDYGFGRGGGAGNQDQQQDNTQTVQEQGTGRGGAQQSEADKKYGGARVSAGGVTWSPDNLMFSSTRTDNRKVADLWVINALANPRPTLETYKYAMPGEESQPQAELHVVDLEAKKDTEDQDRGVQGPADGAGDRADDEPAAREAGNRVALGVRGRRQDLLQPHESRPEAHRHRRGRHQDRGVARRHSRAVEHVHRDPAAPPHQRRQAGHPLVRAGRLGPLLPVRHQRQAHPAGDVGRIRDDRHHECGREDAHAVLHGRGPRADGGPVLPALLQRRISIPAR